MNHILEPGWRLLVQEIFRQEEHFSKVRAVMDDSRKERDEKTDRVNCNTLKVSEHVDQRIAYLEWENKLLRDAWLMKREQELIAGGMNIEQARIHAEVELNRATAAKLTSWPTPETSRRETAIRRDRMMTERTDELLWIGAFRYYCGRKTYAVGSFCEALCDAIPGLPERARFVIERDLNEAFARDDEARKSALQYDGPPMFLPLGHDIDRAEWQKVREAFNRINAGGKRHED